MKKLTRLLVAYSDELESCNPRHKAYRSLYKYLRLLRIKKETLKRLFRFHLLSKCISIISTYVVAWSLKIVEFDYKFIILVQKHLP